MRRTVLAVLAVALVSGDAFASSPPKATSLPDVVWDCFQAYTSVTALPESDFRDVAIDGDNFDPPLVRYRLQVIEKTILKLITDPSRPAYRTEKGYDVSSMSRDFTNKHQIVGWREDSATGITLYTIDFDNRLFSTLKVPRAKVIVPIQLHVFNCR